MVPRNDLYILIVLLLILVGLVLTTTCVDIVGAYYIDRLHFFGRRLDDVCPVVYPEVSPNLGSFVVVEGGAAEKNRGYEARSNEKAV